MVSAGSIARPGGGGSALADAGLELIEPPLIIFGGDDRDPAQVGGVVGGVEGAGRGGGVAEDDDLHRDALGVEAMGERAAGVVPVEEDDDDGRDPREQLGDLGLDGGEGL